MCFLNGVKKKVISQFSENSQCWWNPSQDQRFTPDASSHRGRVHCASDAPFHKCHSTSASSPCAGSSMKMSTLQELLFGSSSTWWSSKVSLCLVEKSHPGSEQVNLLGWRWTYLHGINAFSSNHNFALNSWSNTWYDAPKGFPPSAFLHRCSMEREQIHELPRFSSGLHRSVPFGWVPWCALRECQMCGTFCHIFHKQTSLLWCWSHVDEPLSGAFSLTSPVHIFNVKIFSL